MERASDSVSLQMPSEYKRILELFVDHPSAPLSIHRIARAGEEVGKKAGQWLGPNTVCSALQRLHSRGAFGKECNLQLLLFDSSDGDNTIYKSEARAKLQVCTSALEAYADTENVSCSFRRADSASCFIQALICCAWLHSWVLYSSSCRSGSAPTLWTDHTSRKLLPCFSSRRAWASSEGGR
jgi:hypothetical protein